MSEVPHHLPHGGYEGLEGLAFDAAKMTAYDLEGRRVTVTWSTYMVEGQPRVLWRPSTWKGLKITEVEHQETGILSLEDHTEAMWDEADGGRSEWIAVYLDGDWVTYLEPDTEILEMIP